MMPRITSTEVGSLQLAFTGRALQENTRGLTHEDSLIQPPSGNCLNWVVGHIMASRNLMLRALDRDPVWSEDAAARYVRGSSPVKGPDEKVVKLPRSAGGQAGYTVMEQAAI